MAGKAMRNWEPFSPFIYSTGVMYGVRVSERTLFLSVYLPSAIMAVCNGLLIPILPLYARSFEASYGLVGVVLAAAGLGTLGNDIPAGLLVRRIGHKKVMLLGGVCIIIGVLALTWAQSLVEVVVYRLLTGAGMALWGISRHAYIAEVIQVSRRGRFIAVLGGIGRIGMFLGPALGGVVAKTFGLRAPFLVYAALGVAGMMVVIAWVVDERDERGKRNREADHSFWDVLGAHWRVLLTAGSGQLLGQTVRSARHIIIPLYAADIIGLDVQAVGLIISLSSAVDMMMFYPAGLLMDRLGRKFAYVPSFTMQALGMMLIPATGSFWGLAMVATFIGLANGLGSGTMMTLGTDLAPEKARGEFLGLWRFIGDGGSVASPVVIGSVAGLLGLVHAPLFTAAMGLGGAGVLFFFVPETLQKEDPPPSS